MSRNRWLFANDSWYAHRVGVTCVSGSLDPGVWARYLRHVDNLSVIGRALPDEQARQATTRSSTDGVEIHPGPNISGLRNRWRNIRAARELVRTQVAEVDAVIARLPSEYGLLVAREAQRQDKPWLVELAGCPFDGLWNYGNWQGRLYAPIMAARVRRAVARAPFVIYVTREFLQRRYPNRVGEQIACSNVAIDTPENEVLQQRLARIDRQLEPRVLGLIGTLKTRYKGIQTVFAALARARDRLPPVEFRVLGTGDPESWMREAESYGVRDLVHFDSPRKPGAEVMAWLDEVDLYLQPSFKEGLPRATIEAMSRGCPILGSRCAGIPELLKDECLINPGDERELARLIQHALSHPDWQRREARDNWNTAHEYAGDILEARRHDMLARLARVCGGASAEVPS